MEPELQMFVKALYRCWKLSPDPLEEEQVFLPAETYFQSHVNLFNDLYSYFLFFVFHKENEREQQC